MLFIAENSKMLIYFKYLDYFLCFLLFSAIFLSPSAGKSILLLVFAYFFVIFVDNHTLKSMKKHKTVVIFGAPDKGKMYFIKHWSNIFKILDADLDFFEDFNREFSAGKSVAFDEFNIIFVPKSIEILKKFNGFCCFWTIGSCAFSLFSDYLDSSYVYRDHCIVPTVGKLNFCNYNTYVYFSGSRYAVFNFIISLMKKQQF